METSTNIRAQQRVRLSIFLGLASLIFTLPVLYVLAWIPAEDAARMPVQYALLVGLQIVCTGMGVASVITAFAEGISPRSGQGKTAILLAVLVSILIIPVSIAALFFRIQAHLGF